MLSVNQYNDLFQSVCCTPSDYKTDGSDKFSGQFIEKDKRFTDMWTVCIFVFVFAHGQSQTERGFNINKAMLVENFC